MNQKQAVRIGTLIWVVILAALVVGNLLPERTSTSALGIGETLDIVLILVLVTTTAWYGWWTKQMATQQEREQSVRLRPWVTLRSSSPDSEAVEAHLEGSGTGSVKLTIKCLVENVGSLPARNVTWRFRITLAEGVDATQCRDSWIAQSEETNTSFGALFPGGRFEMESDREPPLPLPSSDCTVLLLFLMEYEGVEGGRFWSSDTRCVTVTKADVYAVGRTAKHVGLPVFRLSAEVGKGTPDWPISSAVE